MQRQTESPDTVSVTKLQIMYKFGYKATDNLFQ